MPGVLEGSGIGKKVGVGWGGGGRFGKGVAGGWAEGVVQGGGGQVCVCVCARLSMVVFLLCERKRGEEG